MLLMSEGIKDKVNVDDLYAEKQDQAENIYINTNTYLDFGLELVYCDGTIVKGTVYEIEKESASWTSEKDFDNLKCVFSTTLAHASKFIFQNDLSSLTIKKDENLIYEKSIDPCCVIITNIKTDSPGEAICTLTLNYHYK